MLPKVSTSLCVCLNSLSSYTLSELVCRMLAISLFTICSTLLWLLFISRAAFACAWSCHIFIGVFNLMCVRCNPATNARPGLEAWIEKRNNDGDLEHAFAGALSPVLVPYL